MEIFPENYPVEVQIMLNNVNKISLTLTKEDKILCTSPRVGPCSYLTVKPCNQMDLLHKKLITVDQQTGYVRWKAFPIEKYSMENYLFWKGFCPPLLSICN